MRWIKPRGYHYLSYWGWFWRELSMFGCKRNLFHIRKGGWGCFCDFWDAE